MEISMHHMQQLSSFMLATDENLLRLLYVVPRRARPVKDGHSCLLSRFNRAAL